MNRRFRNPEGAEPVRSDPPKDPEPIRVFDPRRYVTVSGKVPPQAVTSRYVGRREGPDA